MIKIRFFFGNLFRSMNFDLKVGSFEQQKNVSKNKVFSESKFFN